MLQQCLVLLQSAAAVCCSGWLQQIAFLSFLRTVCVLGGAAVRCSSVLQ